MKTIHNTLAVQTLSLNGVTLTPDLARPYTKRNEGHHVTIRITYNRQVLCYLATGIYVMPISFNSNTKQLADDFYNERLKDMMHRAGKLVGTTLVPAQLKSSWERERIAIEGQSMVESMELTSVWGNYVALVARASKLESELGLVQAAIREMEVNDPGLSPVPITTLVERKDFEKSMSQFMVEAKDSVKDRDFQMWSTWKSRLEEFAQHAGLTLTLLVFDMKFYKAYKSYLMGTRGNKLSTFGAHVKRLKSFLKWSEQNGFTVGTGHKHKHFTIIEEPKTVVYLDDSELNLLWAYKQVKPAYTKHIDLCLFQSLTGLRISDTAKVHHITTQIFDGVTVEYLTGKCQKTGGAYKVPLSLDSRIKEILNSNGFDMKLLSEAHYNRSIKDIVSQMYAHNGLKIPTVIVYREDSKGAVHATETSKNTELGTHSNRRSFVSRHINSNEFNHTDVLAMLGSSDMKELQKYIQVHDKALDDKAKANAVTRAGKR